MTIVSLMTCHRNIIKLTAANILENVPDDMSDVNITSLNYELFEVVDTMKDIDQANQIDLQDYIRKLFLLTWRLPIVDISTMHRYDFYEDKLISGGPKVNRTDCKAKLNHLVDKVHREQLNSSSLVDISNDYRLFNLLNSFGRPSSSFLGGDILWLGNYDLCLDAKYDYSDSTSDSLSLLSNSRYCLAHLRWPHWKTTQGFKEWTYTTVKSAICLPESCDSLSAESGDNKQLIAQLMEINFGSAYKNFQIGDIYCLPDKESSLRQWWLEISSTVCVIFFLIWSTLVIVATLMDFRRHKSTFVRVFSLVSNTKKLFQVSKTIERQFIEGSEEKQSSASLRLLRDSNKVSNNTRSETTNIGDVSMDPVVNMNYLHCVKVILLFIIMRTHFFLFLTPTTTMYNWVVSFAKFDIYLISLAGLMVNVFFIITGILVAYLIFEKFSPFIGRECCLVVASTKQTGQQQTTDKPKHPLLRATVWMGFCFGRYFRLMPLWAILTLTVKYLAKYLGEGPVWDYGTSTGTNSHFCRQESLYLLFLGIVNIKPVYQNCIGSSWYLAIDLQCAFIVAPIAIIAYLK